ncbi:MAG: sigma-70 family RNA polymerase sigma factor [Isosphaeraceae bacterium]|nr:sigma-70 family RNA polymerase sigma factor [Isosphaeraceae bacterium]
MANGQSEVIPKRSGELLHAGMSDGQLLGRFNACRDETAEIAFAGLVNRHGPMVLRVCRQILGDAHRAEDAFQATFLVLARRSGSIGRPELLGNWLYGVALRTAWETKMRDRRRRQREGSAADGVAGEPAGGETGRPEATLIGREEFEALHEELSRLPDRYRIPVVLCALEGLTYQEAASRMDCPVSTIGVRLKRARERLRRRLVRRGIVPAAVAALGAEGAAAWVPSALVSATVRAAIGFAASDLATTGLVSTSVVAITEAVLRTMALTRLKIATSVVLVVGITATVGWVSARRQAFVPASGGQSTSRMTGEASGPERSSVAVRPLLDSRREAAEPLAAATPNSDGRSAAAVGKGLPDAESKPENRFALVSLRRAVPAEQARGEMLFAKEWVPNDPVSRGGDGLGPVYNETSCVACHGLGAPGGAGPDSKNVVIITAIGSGGRGIPKDLERIHPGLRGARSTVLHRFGTDSAYGPWRRRFYESHRNQAASPPKDESETVEARIQKLTEQTALGHRQRERSARLHFPSGVTLRVSERNTPALFGAGRIDAIPSEVLVEEAKRQPADVRGRVNRNRGGRVGRFGWKAQTATLHDFVRGACAGELGLEVPGHSQSASPLAPKAKAKGLDLTQTDCDALVAYVRALPAPVVIDPSGPQGSKDMSEGRRLFAAVGCTGCHTPSLGEVRGIYSDLLLHDMGPILGDSGVSYGIEGPESPGGPSPGEWRTPPLWGFRDSGPYLHDGRAQTLDEAVALHGGQGTKAAREFFSLSPEEQAQVEAFLKSLVAPSSSAAPGIVLAAELEARLEPDEVRRAEALVRRQREEAALREERDQRDARRRQRAAEAAKRAQTQLPIAVSLEKLGKTAGALEFYREIAREAPDTDEGRSAAARMAAILTGERSP